MSFTQLTALVRSLVWSGGYLGWEVLSSACPFCLVFFSCTCVVAMIDAFLVLADGKVVFRLLLSKQAPDSSKASSRSCQTELPLFRSHPLLPPCVVTWGVTSRILSDLRRAAQWLASLWTVAWNSTRGRASGGIVSLTLTPGKAQRCAVPVDLSSVAWREAALEVRWGACLSTFSAAWRIWPKSYLFSLFYNTGRLEYVFTLEVSSFSTWSDYLSFTSCQKWTECLLFVYLAFLNYLLK